MTTLATDVRTRLPNLLVVGVKKAGTTSLFDYLGQHPQVCPGDVKAVNWFKEPDGDLADYAAHFRHAGDEPVRLESPTTYFYEGRPMAERVAATLPDVHAMVSLRDPVARFWSNYQMRRREDPAGVGQVDVETFLERCREAHASGDVEAHPGYADFARGCYVDMLDGWFDVLGAERFRVVFIERWQRDPAALVRDVAHWMDLDVDAVDDIAFGVRNRTHDYRSRWAARVARKTYKAARRQTQAVTAIKPALVRAHHVLNRRNDDTALPPSVRAALVEAYREPNERLAAALHERGYWDLPGWLEPRP